MEPLYRTANHQQNAASSSQSESFYPQPVASHSSVTYLNEPATYGSSQLSQTGCPPFIHDTTTVAYDDVIEPRSSRLPNQQLSPSVSAPAGPSQYSAVCAPTVEPPHVPPEAATTQQSEERTAPRPRKRSRTSALESGSRDRLITCSIGPCQPTNGSFASPYLHGRHVANDHMPLHCTGLNESALSSWLESQSMSAKARSTALKAFRQRQADEQAGLLSCARCSRTFARKDACKKHVARSSCFPASSSSSSRKSSAPRRLPPASPSFLSGGGSSRRSTLSTNPPTTTSHGQIHTHTLDMAAVPPSPLPSPTTPSHAAPSFARPASHQQQVPMSTPTAAGGPRSNQQSVNYLPQDYAWPHGFWLSPQAPSQGRST